MNCCCYENDVFPRCWGVNIAIIGQVTFMLGLKNLFLDRALFFNISLYYS